MGRRLCSCWNSTSVLPQGTPCQLCEVRYPLPRPPNLFLLKGLASLRISMFRWRFDAKTGEPGARVKSRWKLLGAEVNPGTSWDEGRGKCQKSEKGGARAHWLDAVKGWDGRSVYELKKKCLPWPRGQVEGTFSFHTLTTKDFKIS